MFGWLPKQDKEQRGSSGGGGRGDAGGWLGTRPPTAAPPGGFVLDAGHVECFLIGTVLIMVNGREDPGKRWEIFKMG